MRVTVIGAGLLGVATAYFLAQRGHRVVVLERRHGPGFETSFANGGMITPSQADPWNAPGVFTKVLGWLGRDDAPVLLRPGSVFSLLGWGAAFLRNSDMAHFRRNLAFNAQLARYSLSVLRQVRQETPLEYTGAAIGTMKFYRNAAPLQETAWLTREFEAAGVRLEVLDGRGVVAREPALEPVSDRIAGGIFFPDDESGDAHQFCGALAAVAAAEGVEFRYDTEVKGMACVSGEVDFLETSGGRVQSDAYVLAAGSYSTLLSRHAGFTLPVRPVKGYSLTFDTSGWDLRPSVPVIADDVHVAFTPLGTRLRVAGTAEFAGFDTSLREGRLRHMRRMAAQTFPRNADAIEAAPGNGWAGLRPYCCDGVPLIGSSPCRNLFLNTGHGHLGWTMAVGSGKLLADIISNVTPELDPAPYSLSRFG